MQTNGVYESGDNGNNDENVAQRDADNVKSTAMLEKPIRTRRSWVNWLEL